MWGTCKIKLFLAIVFNSCDLTKHTLKLPLKMKCKFIVSRKRPSCRFMHSLCKNENIPMWEKHRCRVTKEIAIHLIRIINLKKLVSRLRVCKLQTGLCYSLGPGSILLFLTFVTFAEKLKFIPCISCPRSLLDTDSRPNMTRHRMAAVQLFCPLL